MELGNFSVSLAVKDLAASRAFYEKLGFRAFGGDAAQNWLILKNETSTDRAVPGDVREEHPDVQPGLGPQRAARWPTSTTCASSSGS